MFLVDKARHKGCDACGDAVQRETTHQSTSHRSEWFRGWSLVCMASRSLPTTSPRLSFAVEWE